MALDVGSVAPDFTLPDENNQPVTLSKLRGQPVVLAFYPAAFSSVCTKELCTFRDSMAALNQANAKVFGISIDTFFTQKAFQKDQGLNFSLLSDFNKEVINKYDVVIPDLIGMRGLAKRATFVIDKEGVIRHAEVLADARNEPNYDAVLSTLKQL